MMLPPCSVDKGCLFVFQEVKDDSLVLNAPANFFTPSKLSTSTVPPINADRGLFLPSSRPVKVSESAVTVHMDLTLADPGDEER